MEQQVHIVDGGPVTAPSESGVCHPLRPSQARRSRTKFVDEYVVEKNRL
ncbi:hypothetical protein EMGR_004575 [Emarellia grisea]